MGELYPYFAGERGFCAGAEDEDADWWGVGTEAFDVDACACSGRVESVAES